MKTIFTSLILVATLVFSAQNTYSDTHDELSLNEQAGQAGPAQNPYVSIKIGVEIAGLEKAAEEAAEGLKLIGESLHELANAPELTDQHQEKIDQTLVRVDELSQSLTRVAEQFPATVEKSMVPVLNATNELSDQIRKIIMLTAIALMLIILAALAAVYYFVLAPGTRSVVKTAKLLDELADALKTTAEIVEISSQQNLRVMEEINRVNKQSK